MQQIMQWMKGHLLEVICGTVGLVGIVFIVLGILLSDVNTALANDSQLISSLTSIKPVNKAMIDAANARKVKIVEQTTNALKKVAEIGKHAPLLEKVFPEVTPGSEHLPFRFPHEYAKARKAMIEQLKANECPTSDEIKDLADSMAAEQARRSSQQAIGARGEGPPPPIDMRSMGGGRRGPSMGFGGPMPPGGPGFGPPRADLTQLRPNMTLEEMVTEIPDCRAAVARARSIYCYAHERTSFDPRPTIENVEKPSLEDMWYAQVALWVQQDVVGALAGLNNRAAATISARGGEAPYVGNLPVKHLQRFVVTGYLPPSIAAGAAAGPPPMGGVRSTVSSGGSGMGPGEAFTNTGSSDTMDVVHFTVELVVEARMLPAVIDEICKVGFYTPLLVTFQEQAPSPIPTGYIYGPSPAVQVRLVFEAGFLRDNYASLIPKKVVADIATGVAFQGGGQPGGGGPMYGPGGPRGMPPMMMGPEGPSRRAPMGHGRPEGM